MSDLKGATKKALIWSAFDKIGQQLIFLVVGVFTARLLTPDEFGLVGALAIFTAISNMLLESGLSLAIIRKLDSTERDHNTVFYFNLSISIVLYLTLFFCAPLIADFYGQPQMTLIARLLFSTIIIYAFGVIQSALLIKQMKFKQLTSANFVSFLCSGIVSVTMAFMGCGVWALVAQAVVMALVKSVMLWAVCGWRPQWLFCKESFRKMFSFSGKLLVGNVISTLTSNFYSFIIGRYFPMSQVGFYVQANKMKEMGSSMIWGAFGSSTYTMLSNLQGDSQRLKHAMRKTIRTVAFVTFPIMLGIAVVAKPFIEILITDKWSQSVPYFQMLCVAAIFYILNSINANFIKISGRSDISLRIDILNAALLVGFLFLTIRFGLMTAIISDIFSKILVYGVYVAVNSRQADYRWREQLSDILPYAAIGIAMVAVTYPLAWVINNNYLLIISQVVVGGGFYFVVNKILKSVILEELLGSISPFLKRR